MKFYGREIVKSIRVIIIVSSLFLISSGDIGTNDSNSSTNIQDVVDKMSEGYEQLRIQMTIAYNNFIDRFFKPPKYDFQVTDAAILKDCIENSLDATQPCILVNLDINNAQNDSITFEFNSRTIVTGDGRQLEKYGGLYNTRQLNEKCETPNFFKLFPNASKKVGMCFPGVSKKDDPVMYVTLTANGKQKEHSFDLKSHIP